MIYPSRLRALCQLNKIGAYFTKEKQEALLRGDISNAVVDRHFVYGLQVLGVNACGKPEQSPAMIRMQARYLQRTWETLIQLQETNQHRAKAQALMLATYATVVAGFKMMGQHYLAKACGIIERESFRFFPEYGPPPVLSEQVHEDVSVLCQAIYLENYLYLTLDGPVPTKTARIEKEFKLDLQVRATHSSLVIALETDLGICSSECIQDSSTHAH